MPQAVHDGSEGDVAVSVGGHIDFELLSALDALMTDRNVTRAAERIGIGQPALSARLTRLREVFGDRLFIPSPSGRGVVPTPRALALAPQAASILEQLATMLEPGSFDANSSDRTFRVACHENPAVMLSPELVAGIQRAAPDVRLLLTIPDEKRMPELLESGAVDLFVGARRSGREEWFSRTLLEDHYVTGQRRDHPRGDGTLDIDAFCEAAHLIVSSVGDPFFGAVDAALRTVDRSRRIGVSIESYAVAPIIIAASDLICTLPSRFLARFAASLTLVAPPVDLPRVEIAAYWHPRAQDDPGHQWLRAQFFAAATAVGRSG